MGSTELRRLVELTLLPCLRTPLELPPLQVDLSTPGKVLIKPSLGQAATVVTPDVEACKAVVHVIDRVSTLLVLCSGQGQWPPVPCALPLVGGSCAWCGAHAMRSAVLLGWGTKRCCWPCNCYAGAAAQQRPARRRRRQVSSCSVAGLESHHSQSSPRTS